MEYQGDGQKAIFYYIAEGGVDFRAKLIRAGGGVSYACGDEADRC